MPAEGYAYPITSCSMASETQKMNSSSSYQKSLSQDVSVGGGWGKKFKFQASGGWNSFNRTTANKRTTRYETKSYCLLYEVGYHHSTIVQPTAAFKASCDALREFTNKNDEDPDMREKLLKAWNAFFTTYGTHFMSVVRLGGKMIHRVDATTKASSTFDKKGWNMDTAMSAKIFKLKINAGYSREQEEQNEEALKNTDIKESVVFIGGLPAARDLENPSVAFAEWAQTVRDQPMPVQYKLLPLCYIGWDVPRLVLDSGDTNALLDLDLSQAVLNPRHYNKYLYEYEKYAIDLGANRWAAEQLTLPVFDRMISFSESQNNMSVGDRMLSSNGKWKCQLQMTGHLVISKKVSEGADAEDELDDEWEDVWSTENQEDAQLRTTTQGANYVAFGLDGVLAVYEVNSSGQMFEQYSIGTGRGIEPYVVMQDNGLLVCFDQSREPIWYAGPGEPGEWNYDAHEGADCTGSRTDILQKVEAPNEAVCGMKCDQLKERCTGFVHVLKVATTDELPKGSNKSPPPGWEAKTGSGACQCKGSGNGLESCGELCCAASPWTDPDPNGEYYYKKGGKTLEDMCYKRKPDAAIDGESNKCYLRQGVVSAPKKSTDGSERNCYISKWAKAQQCALDYCNGYPDLKSAYCGGGTCGEGAAAGEAGSLVFEGAEWQLVRRVKPGDYWHPAKDRLKGTETYGTYDPSPTSNETFSIPFPDGCKTYLLATGDMTKWMIVNKSAVDGTYSNALREVVKSSVNANKHKVKWYNRDGVTEDPWISLVDHDSAVDSGNILYGEDSYGPTAHAQNVLPQHNGANVFCWLRDVNDSPTVQATKCLNHWDQWGKSEGRTGNPDQCMRKGWNDAKKSWGQGSSSMQTVTIPAKSRKYGACWVNPLLDNAKDPIFSTVAATTSWAQAHERCVTNGQRLCSAADVCPDRSAGGIPKCGLQKDLDRWVAVDGDNNWLQVGNKAWPSCQLHTEIGGGTAGKPAWGITNDDVPERVIGACCSYES
uniref:MACPF domain-containing protein n=1 Tax=Eutreptiella gymnastica TaxID=73025 RepID=A0A7S1IMM1_9EUGL